MRPRIDFREEQDLVCCLMGETGMFSKAIARNTGLSPGQVNYRLKLAGIRRKDYRNGDSDMSRLVLSQVAGRRLRRTTHEAATKIMNHLLAQEERLAALTVERLNKTRERRASAS